MVVAQRCCQTQECRAGGAPRIPSSGRGGGGTLTSAMAVGDGVLRRGLASAGSRQPAGGWAVKLWWGGVLLALDAPLASTAGRSESHKAAQRAKRLTDCC